MSLRFVKGQLRTETPRMKDNRQPTERDPNRDRAEGGRFAPGNKAACVRGAKSLIKQSLGSKADPELIEQALTLYRALVREAGAESVSVRQLTAARCRHVVLATRLADLATVAGLGTPEGMKLADASRSHDLAAQRLAVTAFDFSSKEATPEEPEVFRILRGPNAE